MKMSEKPVTWKEAELESPDSELDWLINTLGRFLLTGKSILSLNRIQKMKKTYRIQSVQIFRLTEKTFVKKHSSISIAVSENCTETSVLLCD